MEKIVLDVKELKKYYGNKKCITKAVDGISFQVNEGEFLGIMGASGSGKTTLLNCISTIDQATSGNIFVDEEDTTKLKGNKISDFRKHKLGFIFQQFNLLDTLNAYDNIALGMSIMNHSVGNIKDEIEKVAKQLKIEDVLEKYPYEMSGGQQQRVAAARALVKNPALILADEPTGALDSQSARLLLEQIVELNKNRKSTILMVTHDAFSASYCSRILFIKDGAIFQELVRGDRSRRAYYDEILKVIAVLGGDSDDK